MMLRFLFVVLQLLAASGAVNITKLSVEPGTSVLVNQEVRFICEAGGDTIPQVWWTKDGKNLTNFENATTELRLVAVSLPDSGNYSCHAFSKDSSNQSAAVVVETVQLDVESEPLTSETVGDKVKEGGEAILQCSFVASPEISVDWTKNGVPVITNDDDERVSANVSVPVDFGQVATLSVKNATKADNGTYECVGINERGRSTSSSVDLIVSYPPIITIHTVKGIRPDQIFINWTLDAGNSIMKKILIKWKPEGDGSWNDEKSIKGLQTFDVVDGLLANKKYVFQLAAENSVGMGPWSEVSDAFATPTSDPFGKYKPVMTLSGASKVSVTLKIDPPPKDVMEFIGAYRLNMISVDDKTRVMEKNIRIDEVSLKWSVTLNELMPGTAYEFVARAVHGFSGLAGNASKGVIGATLDAPPSQPQNVAVECFADPEFPVLRVRWDPPKEVGGKIVKYKMKVVMSAIYDDEEGYNQHTVDDLEVQTMGNETRQTVLGTPNTNYSITVTALTQAGPGEWSHRSKESQCFMQPGLPSFIPASKWRPFSESGERRIFMLMPRRVSQRNGPICCYRVVLVRFPGKVGKDAFPDPENVTLRTYEEAHEVENNTYGAYVAEMFGPRELPDVIMLGDELPAPSAKACQLCFSVGAIRRHARSKDSSHPHHHRRERNFYHEALTSPVLDAEDGILSTESTYWGFMEVIVQKPDGHAGVKRSRYFAMDEAPVPGLSAREGPGTSFSTSKLVPIISGILLGVLVVGFLLIGIFFALRNYSKLLAAGQGVEHSFSFSVRHMWASLRGNPEGIPLSQPPPPDRSPIPKSKLVPAFVTRHRDGDAGFRSEFELLPDRFADRTTHSSDDLNNSGKNRYPDIKAYDQTRVTLSKTGTTEEHACSDYINANFVVGFKERKKFICAQGPLLGTVNDFWRMIWEYEVQLMIMLTNFEENRKVKCCHYWPEEGTETYGDITVSCAAEKPYSDYVLRRLRAEKGEGESKETREVAHYHYLVWKDFMAPEHPSGVLKFLKRINSVYTPDKGQILIHCSAGVGRTGTLVALDSLLQEMNEEGKASVFNTVSELRHQRNYLVQSLKQYIFVYRGLMEYAQFGDTEVAQGELRENYQRMIQRPSMEFGSGKGISPMQEEFSRLAEAVEDPKPITYATNEQNEEKNRCSAIVPYDQNRVILSPVFSKPDETYINASFIQGYDHSMSFVITQDPLKSTRVDFWRMVLDHNVTTLVMLSECECEADGDEAGLCDDDDERDALTAAADVMCPQYWPDSADEDVTFDHIRVSLAKIDTLPMFIKRTLTVTNVKNGETVTVKQFQYLGWADSEYADPADKTVSAVPESTSGLLELNSQISRTQETSQEVGIVGVHCRFGGDRSSVFVCLCILLQQLRTERAVDVFQTVRNLRSQRPGMIQHLAQYEFLYKALVDYSDKESP